MPNAVPFNNKAMPSNGDRSMFENLKAECAYRFIENLKARRYSIDPMVLTQKHSGKGYKNNTVKAILLNERKAIARDETDTDKNWRLISKAEMKKNVGHSPDFIESFFMREYFELTKKHNRDVEIYIESNDIGCSRWRYNNSYYWKCPNTDVNSVVKHGAKGVSKQEPVITYEGGQ